MFRHRTGIAAAFGLIFISIGCSHDPRDVVDYSNEPIGMQLLRVEPMLKQRRFNTLLDFESPDDVVFISSQPGATQDHHHAHTGKSSVAIGTAAKINLASVMLGRPFPENWTLAGAYLWSESAATVQMHCHAGAQETQRSIDIPAGKWTGTFVDLTHMTPASGSSGHSIEFTSDQPLLCDDLMLIDNTTQFVDVADSPWTIWQKGFKITVERDKWFTLTLDTVDETSTGWNVDTVSTTRATFTSTGKTKWLTIYSDGRSYWDGRFEPLSGNAKSDPLLGREHDHPGTITVAEGMGRLDRNSPGDADNDGYNETLGAYELIGVGARMEFTIASRGVPLVRPMIEIAGLPAGKPLVTLDGRLVESLTRLKNGNILIEIPLRIEQPTTVNVRVE